MKDQTQRQIFEKRPLKSLCQMNLKSLGENTDPDRQIQYIDIGGVSYQEGVTSRETLTFSSAPSRARRCVEKNDIIISTVRTYLRALAMINEIDDGAIASTGFAVCRANETTDPKFLYYAMMAEPFINQVIIKSTGISYPAINSSTLGGIKLPVPDHRKQQAISGFLDRETLRIDDLIAEKASFITLLREKRVAEISRLVREGDGAPLVDTGIEWRGHAPAGWTRGKLKALFRQAKRQGYDDLTVLSVYRDYGVIEKHSRDDNINKTPENLSKYQLVEPGDLVINKMKAWQGSMGISDYRGITSPDYVVMTPKLDVNPRYLHHYLRARPMPWVYRQISNGIRTDQWRLEPEKFLDLPIFLPSQEEQATIADAIDRETTRIDGLIHETEHSIALLKEKRAALITAAVTGKIDVRNAA